MGSRRGVTLRVGVQLDEAGDLVELARLEEVEEGPELGHVVLQRRAREHELAPALELAHLVEDL